MNTNELLTKPGTPDQRKTAWGVLWRLANPLDPSDSQTALNADCFYCIQRLLSENQHTSDAYSRLRYPDTTGQ